MPMQRCLVQGGLHCQTVLAKYLRVLLRWLQLASLLMFEACPQLMVLTVSCVSAY